ncbi:MAG: formyl transferase [Deltaproteobacteria bacterium]|nr:formyl transferase [Deltaproteobacteria bacterium]
MTTFPFGWFSSGRDQAAIDLFTAAWERMESGVIPGRIAYVFCDRDLGETPASDKFLAEVKARGIPLVTNSSRELRHMIRRRDPGLDAAREAFDAKTIELLRGFEAQVVVLAGYMLIVSPLLCRTFLCLNLHPAVPDGPKGAWQEVMWQLMAPGAKEAGAMMHLATPELDEGPTVTYFRFPLTGPDFDPLWTQFARKLGKERLAEIKAREGEAEPLFARIRAEELRREFPLILLTLKNLAEGRFRLTPAGVEVKGRLAPGGIDISVQVEEFLKK